MIDEVETVGWLGDSYSRRECRNGVARKFTR